MDTSRHPGRSNEQRDVRHPALRQLVVYYDMDSVPPCSEPLRVLVSGDCAVDLSNGGRPLPSLPRPLVQSAKHTAVWMVACWIPFCMSLSCSIGPASTSTKDQIHNTVFLQPEVHFTYAIFLMSYCHRTTAQYNSKTSLLYAEC
jgi:hypothetical protein